MEHTLSNLGLVNSLKDFEAKFIQQIIRAEVHLLSMFAAYVCIGVCVIVLFFSSGVFRTKYSTRRHKYSNITIILPFVIA